MTETMKRIKKEIEENGIQQSTLAKKLGVTSVTIHRWMTGKRDPSIRYVEQMVAVLDMNILIWR